MKTSLLHRSNKKVEVFFGSLDKETEISDIRLLRIRDWRGNSQSNGSTMEVSRETIHRV